MTNLKGISEISDLSFSSQIELNDINNSHLLSTQNLLGTTQNQEIAATVNDRHRLLNLVFHAWIDAIKKMKVEEIKKMNFKRTLSIKLLKRFFAQWKDRLLLFQKLHNLGQNMLISKHFQFWNNTVIQKFEERKRFMQFLLKRRSLYQHTFFHKWLHSMNLVKRYHQIGLENNLKLGKTVVAAFLKNIRLCRHQRDLESEVRYIHEKFVKLFCMFTWKKKLRLIRLAHRYQKDRMYRITCRCFDKWVIEKKKRNILLRKIHYLKKNHYKHLKRQYFEKWRVKFMSKEDIQYKIDMTKNMIKKRAFVIYFMKWVSKFNQSNYLTTSANAFLELMREINLRRAFSIWHAKYDIINKRFEKTERCIKEMKLRYLSRYFMRFRAQYAIHHYDRIMTKKSNRRLGMFTKRLYWDKWQVSAKVHFENQAMLDSAKNFRIISLKIKAFNRFKIYCRNMQIKKYKLRLAQAHYVYHLECCAMITWKFVHRQTKRRFLMVSSVLKVWAHNLQKKKFEQWLNYTKYKQNKRLEYVQAAEMYEKRNIALVIESFVTAAKSLPNNQMPNSSVLDSSDDFLKSSISNEELVSVDIDFEINKDDQSKSNFMEIPQNHSFSDDLEQEQIKLKAQIEDVMLKIDNCADQQEKRSLNQQLTKLIEKGNLLLAKLQ